MKNTLINAFFGLAKLYFTVCAGFLLIGGIYVRDLSAVIVAIVCLALAFVVLPGLKKAVLGKKLLIALITVGLCASSHAEGEFKLLSVPPQNPKPNAVAPPITGIVIGIVVIAIGYGVLRVVIKFCDTYLGTNQPPANQTNAFKIQKSADGLAWSDVGNITCARQDFQWSEISSNPAASYRLICYPQ